MTLLKAFSQIPGDIEGDAFGKIYEYLLGEFARPPRAALVACLFKAPAPLTSERRIPLMDSLFMVKRGLPAP